MSNTTLSEISKAQLSANTTLSSVTSSANDQFGAIHSGAAEDIDTLVSSAFDQLRSVGFDGVTGLEIGKVSQMQDAITWYVGEIQTALEPLKSSDATQAFGQRMHEKIELFVAEVEKACAALISNMESFNKDLDAVKTAMIAKADSVNTNIGNTTSNLSSTASGWKYAGSKESN